MRDVKRNLLLLLSIGLLAGLSAGAQDDFDFDASNLFQSFRKKLW